MAHEPSLLTNCQNLWSGE